MTSSMSQQEINWLLKNPGRNAKLEISEIKAEVADFEGARCRTLQQRLNYSFISTYKPVLDDAEYLSFKTMVDYRVWCDVNMPPWLGYGR